MVYLSKIASMKILDDYIPPFDNTNTWTSFSGAQNWIDVSNLGTQNSTVLVVIFRSERSHIFPACSHVRTSPNSLQQIPCHLLLFVRRIISHMWDPVFRSCWQWQSPCQLHQLTSPSTPLIIIQKSPGISQELQQLSHLTIPRITTDFPRKTSSYHHHLGLSGAEPWKSWLIIVFALFPC